MCSQRKELRRDPTSTTDAGGSPDSPVFTHHHTHLPARGRRVRPTFRQTTRSAWSRAYSALSTVPDQREENLAIHLHSGCMCVAILLYPHAGPENRHRAHTVSATRTKAAADLEPGRGESSARGTAESSSSRPACDPVQLWAQGRRSNSAQGERYRQRPARVAGSPRQGPKGPADPA